MADDSQAYTPEDLAALEATARRIRAGRAEVGDSKFAAQHMSRLIHQLRQQTASADQADADLLGMRLDLNRAMMGEYRALRPENQWLCDLARERSEWKARAEAAEREAEDAANKWVTAVDRCHDATRERDAARTALAAAEVERERLVAALEAVARWQERYPLIANRFHVDTGGHAALEGVKRALAASPHADLAAVRAAVTALQSYADGHVDCTSCARQALAALPTWCREQP